MRTKKEKIPLRKKLVIDKPQKTILNYKENKKPMNIEM